MKALENFLPFFILYTLAWVIVTGMIAHLLHRRGYRRGLRQSGDWRRLAYQRKAEMFYYKKRYVGHLTEDEEKQVEEARRESR